MRIIYDIFCKSEIKLSAITPENFAGTRGGPFDPTSVEATALAMTVLEAVGVMMISTPASRRMYGIPGCAAHRECACMSAACAPRHATDMKFIVALRWCRSDELDTEEGVAQFAAYLVDFMHGPGAQNDRQYVPKPDEDVTIGALGEGATALYKTAVRARADA